MLQSESAGGPKHSRQEAKTNTIPPFAAYTDTGFLATNHFNWVVILQCRSMDKYSAKSGWSYCHFKGVDKSTICSQVCSEHFVLI